MDVWDVRKRKVSARPASEDSRSINGAAVHRPFLRPQAHSFRSRFATTSSRKSRPVASRYSPTRRRDTIKPCGVRLAFEGDIVRVDARGEDGDRACQSLVSVFWRSSVRGPGPPVVNCGRFCHRRRRAVRAALGCPQRPSQTYAQRFLRWARTSSGVVSEHSASTSRRSWNSSRHTGADTQVWSPKPHASSVCPSARSPSSCHRALRPVHRVRK